MLRFIGLQHHASGQIVAPCAARHLRQKLERAFRRAVVGQIQRRVGGNYADKRDVREIVSLGDHLRADQRLRLP